jgi:hypothetical protein
VSTPLDRAPGPDDPSPYAPRWVREGGPRPGSPGTPTAPSLLAGYADPPGTSDDFDGFDEPAPAGRFRLPRSLDPTILPEPSRHSGTRRLILPVGLFAAAISGAAVVAWFVVAALPHGAAPTGEQKAANSFQSRFADGASQRSIPPVPRLVVRETVSRAGEETFALGVGLEGAGPGVGVALSGLPAGASLSSGRPAGANGWQLSAAELDNASVRPPRGFAGAMDILVERRPLRFERVAPPAPSPRQATRQIDADELAMLLKRGEEFIATGDLAAARLVLQRAAESGDARAALALAGTYDPNVLDQLGAKGFAPDIALAQAWYEKAKDFGSAEAPQRLERLASRDH